MTDKERQNEEKIIQIMDNIYFSIQSHCPKSLIYDDTVLILRKFRSMVTNPKECIKGWQRLDFIGDDCSESCKLTAYTLKNNFNIDSIFLAIHTRNQERVWTDDILSQPLICPETGTNPNPCTNSVLLLKTPEYNELKANEAEFVAMCEANLTNSNYKEIATAYFRKQIDIIKPKYKSYTHPKTTKKQIIPTMDNSSFNKPWQKDCTKTVNALKEQNSHSWYQIP